MLVKLGLVFILDRHSSGVVHHSPPRAIVLQVRGRAKRLIDRRVVDLNDADRRFQEQASGALTGAEDPRMQVQRAALGQHVAGARAADPDDRIIIADIDDGGMNAVDLCQTEPGQEPLHLILAMQWLHLLREEMFFSAVLSWK